LGEVGDPGADRRHAGAVPAVPMRVAVFDVDGTLVDGQLGAPLPRALAEAGVVSEEGWTRLHDHLASMPADGLEDPATIAGTYALYADMLRGVSTEAVASVVHRVWEQRRHALFGFVAPLLADVRDLGFVPMLISGGIDELVALAAADLGVARFRGLRLERADGVYTGAVRDGPVSKSAIADELAEGRPVDWPESIAAGDSLPDAALLERAGHPFAFEPTPALGKRARDEAWPVADRETLLPLVRSRVGVRTLGAGEPALAGPGRRRRRPPAPDALPQRLSLAQRRLTDHLASHVQPDGSLDGHCESRVVESALMLTLLRRERLLPELQDTLRRYLARRAPGAAVFDAALIDAVLKGVHVDDPDPIVARALAGTDHAGLGRKRLALSAVLAVVDAAPFTHAVAAEAFEPGIEPPWTRTLLRAVKVLCLAEYGAPEGPELEELILALEAGGRRGVYEKHLFVHLMALLALQRARPGHTLIAGGVAHLATCRRPDGGLPFLTDMVIYATATGGLALARAGADPSLLAAMAAFVASHQAPDGGWSWTTGVAQTDVDDTTHAVRFLHAARGDGDAIERGRDNLRAIVGPDGGFPTYLAGQRSEPVMTAGAVLALAPRGFADAPLLEDAGAFLLEAQRPDSTFGRGWSLSESAGIWLSVAALRAAGASNPALHRGRLGPSIDGALHRLLYTPQAGGGWGQTPALPSDPISTAYALLALAHTHAKSAQALAAVEYLLAEQRADGGYASPPDQSGPRPLPYDVPMLANNFVLMALTAIADALRGEAQHSELPARPRLRR